MPDVPVTIPTAALSRVKFAYVALANLGPDATNAEVLAAVKADLVQRIRTVVRNHEAHADEANIDADGVAS